ncbi:MAG: hypothetical protein IPM12_14970 [Flavobacteriales bacterium]|nr:hypothetical protein [Flavobacteriales bacterium]
MSSRWNHPGLPHKGWRLVDVEDIRSEGQSESETDYETCQMCGNEKIRFVHTVSHPEHDEELRVGCVCAEKMTSDYSTPRRRETELRNRASRRRNWTKKKWKVSDKGSYYLKLDGKLVLIYRDKSSSQYKVKVDETWGKKRFKDLDDAKMAAFQGIEYLKELGTW